MKNTDPLILLIVFGITATCIWIFLPLSRVGGMGISVLVMSTTKDP
jgi:hypothetical protein